MTITEARRLNPVDRSLALRRLPGAERGRYDAEVIADFLGTAATSGAYKHKVYNLDTPEDRDAHEALVETLDVDGPDFAVVPEDSYVVEPLGFEGRLVRQLILQDQKPIVYYIASSTPFPEAA